MTHIIYIIIYVIGYFVSIILMHKFHKALGMDYNKPKTYSNCDDWDNNAQAFAGISVGWPLFWLVTLFMFLMKKIVKFSSWVEDNFKENNEYLDKIMKDNQELKDNLAKIKSENEKLIKRIEENEK